jgi:hypothetical protein
LTYVKVRGILEQLTVTQLRKTLFCGIRNFILYLLYLILILKLVSHSRLLEDNIKMKLKEIEWEGVDLLCLAQDTDKWRDVVNTAMNHPVPLQAGNFLTG